jgi:hypothetical protein
VHDLIHRSFLDGRRGRRFGEVRPLHPFGIAAVRPSLDSQIGDRVATTMAIVKPIYCTIVNAAFVPRALALQRSVAKHEPSAWFAFYCIDQDAVPLLERHASGEVKIVPPAEFETQRLRAAKAELKLNEYCWTCKPVVLLHALGSFAGLDWAIWLDSDMLAFGDLSSECRRHPNASVILTPHRFSLPEFAAYEPAVGTFNAGYVAFHNNENGLAALTWWLDRCLEGCPAEPTVEAYADQKYLDVMAQKFSGVATSDSLGLNCAPWNVFKKEVAGSENGVTIEGYPLMLYHFQGFKIIRDWAFDLYGARLRLPAAVRKFIYAPYLDALVSEIHGLAQEFNRPWMGVDYDFIGIRGLFRGARRIRWSSNVVLKF